jgi:hypothetical protein
MLIKRKDDDLIELTQTGLINHIITAMGLDDANISKTPTQYGGLGKDTLGMNCQEEWSYQSILGMILLFMQN